MNNIKILVIKSKLSFCFDNKNNKENCNNMLQSKPSQARSFRLKTKKKQIIKENIEEKEDSSSSVRSSFSIQYHVLTKKMKMKSQTFVKSNVMGSTVSSFGYHPSFRIKTESTFSKKKHQNAETTFAFIPVQDSYADQMRNSLSFRGSTSLTKTPIKFQLSSYQKKVRKNFRIQKPSIYCNIEDEHDEISPTRKVKMLNGEQQLSISNECSKQRLRLLQNCEMLWDIRKQMTQKNNKIKPKQVLRCIKNHILRKQQKGQSNNIEKVLNNPEQQKDLKELLAYERSFIIGIVQLISREKLHYLCIEYVNILDNLLGFFIYLLKQVFNSNSSFKFFQTGLKQYEAFISQVQSDEIQQKKSLTSTLLFMCAKLHQMFRYSSELLKLVKAVIANSRKSSVNRSFYDLLTSFAVYLNYQEAERIDQNNSIGKYMASFTTCPSPYIIEPRGRKNYTLVLDLDQTLVSTKLDKTSSNLQYSIQYRPYCKQFISNLSQWYEIIIFTSSIASYAEEVISKFAASVSHVLCREHTIKVKGETIKDISRIGRSLETTVIVDNMPQNFELQKENGIEVVSWYGGKQDAQLRRIQAILLQIVSNNPKDIRQPLKNSLTKLNNNI